MDNGHETMAGLVGLNQTRRAALARALSFKRLLGLDEPNGVCLFGTWLLTGYGVTKA